jgi:adenylosuccinate lyase
MIKRYARPEMSALWSESEKVKVWTLVEYEVCRSLNEDGLIQASEWRKLKKGFESILNQKPLSLKRMEQLELKTRHDVLAFIECLSERFGSEGRWIHYGLTSSDVVDTALSIRIQRSGAFILKGLLELASFLKNQADRNRDLITLGRSHGIYAEPISFGLKFLSFYAEIMRCYSELSSALEKARVGKLSGAVGISPHWNLNFEKRTLARLGLKPEPCATQVVARDRYASVVWACALVGAALERMAIEFRHLQRSEVDEIREGFTQGQKGSSAMPHKRNPISSENITGGARMLRSYLHAPIENIALWHERDISHSSVERVFIPDVFVLTDYLVFRMSRVVEALEVRREVITERVRRAGARIFSGHILLDWVRSGVSRERAYRWLQEVSMGADEDPESFLVRLRSHPEVRRLKLPVPSSFDALLDRQVKNVELIYARVYREYK